MDVSRVQVPRVRRGDMRGGSREEREKGLGIRKLEADDERTDRVPREGGLRPFAL
jgi:hypothetical protein